MNILIENALKPYIKIETADDKYALISTVSGINSRLSAVETFFATEDSDTLINKWSEIVAFLNATEGDTLDNILATKANQSALDAAVASLTAEIGKKWTQNDAKISNWDSAYGWGNHANAGYAAKTYVDGELAKYILKDTAQDISALHNFVNGLQIGGLSITKSASANNTIYLDANLVVSGAITMFGSGSTTFPTIWADIPFNLEHMSWDGSQWNIIGGGGSLDTNAVNELISNYLTKNSYATQRWVGDNATKYIGAASVDSARHAIGYDNLSMGSVNIPTAGGFISADQGNYGFQILGSILSDNLYWRGINGGNLGNWTKILDSDNIGEYALLPSGGTMKEGSGLYNEADQNGYGAIGFNSTHNAFGSPLFPTKLRSSIDPTLLMGSSEFTLIHSGNIGQQSVNYANSAGLLATPVILWGQPFYGNNSISGSITGVSFIQFHTTDKGMYRGDTFNEGLTANDVVLYGNLVGLFGNVAIGGTTADAKLHVHGNIQTTGNIEGGIFGLRNSSPDNPLLRLTVGNQNYYVQATSDGIYLGPTSTLSLKVDANGNTTINGNLLTTGYIEASNTIYVSASASPLVRFAVGNSLIATFGYESGYGAIIQSYNGGNYFLMKDDNTAYISCNTTINGNLLTTGVITMFSQLSMKNVIDYDGLSLAQLAQIRPARFTWKDGRDSLVHAGGIADEVMQVLPEVVYKTSDDKLTMDYGSAGFFMAASLIKPMIDHEQRLQSAEKEIKDLRAENKRLREQLRIA